MIRADSPIRQRIGRDHVPENGIPQQEGYQKTRMQKMISFSEHSEKYGLDDEEREILAAFEAGKVSPDADSEMNVETLRKAATETMREIAERRRTNATKPVTLRVPVRVIERYKKRASADGIGYQTLMNEILDAAMV